MPGVRVATVQHPPVVEQEGFAGSQHVPPLVGVVIGQYLEGSQRVVERGHLVGREQERRVELAFEGHRFFDLKRLGLDIVKAAPVQNLNFTDFRLLAPIPIREIQANANLKQNTGY